VEIEADDFWDDMKWGEKNYPKLMRQYPEKWVAIVNKTVVGVGKSISEAEREAHKKTGIEIKRIPVIFVERGTNIY
jgi:hypothetical protein